MVLMDILLLRKIKIIQFNILIFHLIILLIIGDTFDKGILISFVGPKCIDNVLNNPYKDSTGKSTNGATTGTHLHLTIKKDGIPINPLDFFE